MVALLNTVRASVGVAPLGDESRLDAAADAHAADMATHHFLGHYGSDGLNEDGRVRAAGYNFQMVAECVAKGQRDTRSVFLAWINDKSHRDIILNPGLTQVGLGTHTWGIGAIPYWCLVLASPKEGS